MGPQCCTYGGKARADVRRENEQQTSLSRTHKLGKCAGVLERTLRATALCLPGGVPATWEIRVGTKDERQSPGTVPGRSGTVGE